MRPTRPCAHGTASGRNSRHADAVQRQRERALVPVPAAVVEVLGAGADDRRRALAVDGELLVALEVPEVGDALQRLRDADELARARDPRELVEVLADAVLAAELGVQRAEVRRRRAGLPGALRVHGDRAAAGVVQRERRAARERHRQVQVAAAFVPAEQQAAERRRPEAAGEQVGERHLDRRRAAVPRHGQQEPAQRLCRRRLRQQPQRQHGARLGEREQFAGGAVLDPRIRGRGSGAGGCDRRRPGRAPRGEHALQRLLFARRQFARERAQCRARRIGEVLHLVVERARVLLAADLDAA
jgi:hypothetical protein